MGEWHYVGESGEPELNEDFTFDLNGYARFKKSGSGLVTVDFYAVRNEGSAGVEVIFTLPEGYRPAEDVFYGAYNGGDYSAGALLPRNHTKITSSGNVQTYFAAGGAAHSWPVIMFDAGPEPAVVPIGAIVAWHKSFANTPALPSEFVECNGQTLSDAESPYNGQVIPDLNGGARFLRGGALSGTMQDDALQGHKHQYAGWSPTNQTDPGSYIGARAQANLTSDVPVTDGTNGTPRTASETRPKNMSVVWIMRIK